MKRYDDWVLGQLLDKYENSVSYLGQAKRTQRIMLPIQKKTLPEYYDLSSMTYETIHQQLEALEDEGYVVLVWKKGHKGHILEKCILNQDRLEACYQKLRRQPKREKEQTVERILEEYRDRNPVMSVFCGYLSERIGEGKRVRRYLDPEKPEELERLCRLVCAIIENQEEIYLREFSVRHFQDTKYVEKHVAKAAEILWEFGADAQVVQQSIAPEELLEEHGIYKNPSWVMMKGCGCFQLPEGGAVELSVWKDGLGIPSSSLWGVEWQSGQVERVLTVENLTTFHRIILPDTLILYLGGYANPVKRRFLQKIYQTFPDAGYEHFGDLDCGGFRIWRHLRESTGIPFRTKYMDPGTFRRFLVYGKELTENDRKELQRMLVDDYYTEHQALFREMLETGRKLEQESVEL